jgi:hypothetical protein
MHTWAFLSNHALVLLSIARDPAARLSDIARDVGITERATQRLVGDLIEAGYLVRERTGRRNVYQIQWERRLRHPLERHGDVGALVALLTGPRPQHSADERPSAVPDGACSGITPMPDR